MSVGSKISDNMRSALTAFFEPFNRELMAMLPNFPFVNNWKTKL